MASVRLLVDISGTRDGEDWPGKGEVVDLPADEADHMIAGGLAEAATAKRAPVEAEKVEAAVVTNKPRARK